MAAARMGEHDFRNDYAPTDASHAILSHPKRVTPDPQASHANANKSYAFLLFQYHAHYVIRERSFGMAAARMGEHDFRNDYAPTDASHGFSRA